MGEGVVPSGCPVQDGRMDRSEFLQEGHSLKANFPKGQFSAFVLFFKQCIKFTTITIDWDVCVCVCVSFEDFCKILVGLFHFMFIIASSGIFC